MGVIHAYIVVYLFFGSGDRGLSETLAFVKPLLLTSAYRRCQNSIFGFFQCSCMTRFSLHDAFYIGVEKEQGGGDKGDRTIFYHKRRISRYPLLLLFSNISKR